MNRPLNREMLINQSELKKFDVDLHIGIKIKDQKIYRAKRGFDKSISLEKGTTNIKNQKENSHFDFTFDNLMKRYKIFKRRWLC